MSHLRDSDEDYYLRVVALGGYIEKEWADHFTTELAYKFPKLDSKYLPCTFLTKAAELIERHMFVAQPERVFEVGASVFLIF